MKIGFGRLRPKLLFRSDLYGFTWLGWRPDHWSFPVGPQRHDRRPIQRPMVAVAAAFAVLHLGGGDRRRKQGRGRCTLSERRDGRGARCSVVDTVCGAGVCSAGALIWPLPGKAGPVRPRCRPGPADAVSKWWPPAGGGLAPAAKAGNWRPARPRGGAQRSRASRDGPVQQCVAVGTNHMNLRTSAVSMIATSGHGAVVLDIVRTRSLSSDQSIRGVEAGESPARSRHCDRLVC